ncbi:unnamed protein product [Caenorhabditis auriculariae]|uniref:Uncharacterized protein n=1 Tax=Caenorhabditis auriculariae TaxID=2777116 RepID=A0A8S1HWY2_9PELO|nr:unnamed protein product [Caenorhabditis auriculariae]
MLKFALFFALGTVCYAGAHHFEVFGDCKELQEQLIGSGDAAEKLKKFNDFLATLGDGTVGTQFWALVSTFKANLHSQLTTNEGKEAAVGFVDKFEKGELFVSPDEARALLQETSEKIPEADREPAKIVAKTYAEQIKKLVLPVLPESCKPPVTTPSP